MSLKWTETEDFIQVFKNSDIPPKFGNLDSGKWFSKHLCWNLKNPRFLKMTQVWSLDVDPCWDATGARLWLWVVERSARTQTQQCGNGFLKRGVLRVLRPEYWLYWWNVLVKVPSHMGICNFCDHHVWVHRWLFLGEAEGCWVGLLHTNLAHFFTCPQLSPKKTWVTWMDRSMDGGLEMLCRSHQVDPVLYWLRLCLSCYNLI